MKYAKNIIAIFCLVTLLLSMSSCTLYHSGKEELVENGGVTYITSGYFKVCFVTDITIPEGQTDFEITIPDRLDSGHKVEGIGGYVGTGVPTPCRIHIEGIETEYIDDADEYEKILEADEFIEYTLTLNVGKNINKIMFSSFRLAYDEPYLYLKANTNDDAEKSEPRYIRVRVIINVAEENQRYYSVDGRVYTKEADTNT